ncbi:MAG TPA: CRTAC1 family protein [Thermoanaerobaculia bacterium]|nr:CRTAC1 family protein [Thermoanaerobaculia bacterium]
MSSALPDPKAVRRSGPRRRRWWVFLLLAPLAVFGVWLSQNAPLSRLVERFVPEMKRLEAFRDGLDAVRAALLSGNVAPPNVDGAGPLVDWARRDLVRVDFAEYDVLHARDGEKVVRGRVAFRVGGVRADGARVERTTELPVEATIGEGNCLLVARLVDDGWTMRARETTSSAPRFRDATADAGLGAPRRDPDEKVSNLLIEGIWPGSGVAVLDVDGDGIDDLFVGDGRQSILYKNDGCGHFADMTEKAGLAAPPIPATGVVAADFDGDGFDDLFVTNNFGPSKLLRNRGDGTFEDVTAKAGVGRAFHSRSAAFADVDGNGTLDLFVCSTGDYYRQMPDPPFDAHDGGENQLFLNNGDGTFTDATERFGLKQTRWSLSCAFADLDGDGRPDLVVTNDFGLKNVYRNVDGKRFVDVAKKAGALDRGYGMSVAIADFSGDGLLDLHFSGTYTQWGFVHDYAWVPFPLPGRIFLSFARDWMEKMCRGNSFLQNRGDGTFEDVTAASGVGKAGWCWSGVAGDLDNDGRPDLYDANGMWDDGRKGDRELEFWWETLAYWDDYIAGTKTFQRQGKGVQGCERNRYFRNAGDGRFEDRSYLDGVDLQANGRAAVLDDFDGDGSLDVYVRSVQHPETLFLGTRRAGERYVELRLEQPGKNRAAVGARVSLTLPDGRLEMQELQTTSGFLSSGSKKLHFGLGSFRTFTNLTVRWPWGETESFVAPPRVDGIYLLKKGAGSPIRLEH